MSASQVSAAASSPLSSSQTLSSPEDDTNIAADVPGFSYLIPTDKKQRTDGLKLIADSIAQQRQAQSYALITHPLSLALLLTMYAILYQLIGIGTEVHILSDYPIGFTIGASRPNIPNWILTSTGGTMIFLALVRMLGAGFLSAAEDLKWDFLRADDSAEEDTLICAKFGEEIIGALALRIEGESNKRKGGKVKNGSGLIRAWTVRLRFRHKGVGTGLLEEAVRVTREKAGRDAKTGFAVDHANSLRILPDSGIFGVFNFNRHFRVKERAAIRYLEEVERGEAKGQR